MAYSITSIARWQRLLVAVWREIVDNGVQKVYGVFYVGE
jgi:hypothetical protein